MEALSVPRECRFLSVSMENTSEGDVNRRYSDYVDDENQDESSVSDCESGISGSNTKESRPSSDGLIEIYEEDELYEIIKRRFVSGLDTIGMRMSICSIRRNCFSTLWGQAKAQSFQIFAQAMEKKCGGDANVKYAWYGASRDEIWKIINHGFGDYMGGQFTGVHRRGGIYLAPDNLSIDSVNSAIADEDGLRHVLLCRVIMGKTERIYIGSSQFHPSTDEFDSGADDITYPKKYLIWSSHMNTHILPEYVISFRTHPFSEGRKRIQKPRKLPTSPWMPFSDLISALSQFMPREKLGLIIKHHNDHTERKISRHELIRRVRDVAGDKLLTAVIKSFTDKKKSRKSKDSSSGSISYKRSGGD